MSGVRSPGASRRSWQWVEGVRAAAARVARSAATELDEVAAADDQRLEPRLQGAFEGAVLDLDGDVAVVADVAERREEGAPADVAQPRDLGRVPELRIRQDPELIERGPV